MYMRPVVYNQMVQGLKMKYTSPVSSLAYLDEGFLDLTTAKLVELSSIDLTTYPDQARYVCIYTVSRYLRSSDMQK